ncbi:alpha/beta hydrolase [Haloferax namakaokahaiae]|uniref:Alpha/beta hydrolase n=1 Tax=Haloferax namakaokahaiae TaxID=1748331 RepID=A0ABD5ZH43_9EURY
MRVESVTLDVGGKRYRGKVNSVDGTPDGGVLVVPGAGHGPFGDVFDHFASAAAEEGYTVARFETWESPEDVADKTDSEFEAEVEAGIDLLRSRGCDEVAVVAKSFGGRLTLRNPPESADRIVLWAPAVRFGNHDGPSVSAEELAAIETPVRILQGDEDEVVSPENAAALAEHLSKGSWVRLRGEDHSFTTDEARVVEETLRFL